MAYRVIPFTGAFLDENADPIAGATVTVTIRNAAGTAVVTSGACTERTGEGGSFYIYLYTPTTQDTFSGVMSTTAVTAVQNWLLVGSETSVDTTAPSSLTAQQVWEYATRTLTSGGGSTAEEIWEWPVRTLTSPTLTFNAPFSEDSVTLTIVRGDTYDDGDSNRPLAWSGTTWPDLTAGSVVLLMRSVSAPNDVQSFTGTVTSASAVEVELTSTQTGALDVSDNKNTPAYHYALVATLADGGIVTLVRGNVIVRKTPLNL